MDRLVRFRMIYEFMDKSTVARGLDRACSAVADRENVFYRLVPNQLGLLPEGRLNRVRKPTAAPRSI